MKWSPVLVLIAALSASMPLPVAGQIGRGATRPKVERPDGPVWNVIRKNCTQCHGIDRVMKSRFSLDEWRVIAVQMKARGANISDVDLERLVEWLARVKGTNANQ